MHFQTGKKSNELLYKENVTSGIRIPTQFFTTILSLSRDLCEAYDSSIF